MFRQVGSGKMSSVFTLGKEIVVVSDHKLTISISSSTATLQSLHENTMMDYYRNTDNVAFINQKVLIDF